ncbi:uncharacterized protein LOC124510171 [Lynx rufus]|uniref:uncharacterized protein LOC124510171 n=1 Tax=Lynx rufus TaxID=61384 RepID=UPI001F12829A|nr:uncharacterized protein LOC124510171 [Lynx rufus]
MPLACLSAPAPAPARASGFLGSSGWSRAPSCSGGRACPHPAHQAWRDGTLLRLCHQLTVRDPAQDLPLDACQVLISENDGHSTFVPYAALGVFRWSLYPWSPASSRSGCDVGGPTTDEKTEGSLRLVSSYPPNKRQRKCALNLYVSVSESRSPVHTRCPPTHSAACSMVPALPCPAPPQPFKDLRAGDLGLAPRVFCLLSGQRRFLQLPLL